MITFIKQIKLSKRVNNFPPLTIFPKTPITDISQSPK